MPAQPLHVQLPQYEGPLDLLLDLIRKHEIDIYDIPIAAITAQYLVYMQQAVDLDIELGSEFVFMAATLIQIKSRMLLPHDPELSLISPEEDPRQELVERLLQHQRFKNAAEMLQQKRLVEEATWSHPQIEQFADEGGPALSVTIFELVRTLQTVLERAKTRPMFEVDADDTSVPEMMHFVSSRLRRLRDATALSANELFESQHTERAIICLFLAILELVKRRGVALSQKEAFGDIAIERGPAFEEMLDLIRDNRGELAAVESEYH